MSTSTRTTSKTSSTGTTGTGGRGKALPGPQTGEHVVDAEGRVSWPNGLRKAVGPP